MDVKTILEKYATNDEYAKKIVDKLLVQVERIEKEKMELFKWNRRLLNQISKENDLLNVYVLGCALLLSVLQCIVCESLGIVGLDIEMLGIFTIINLIISIGLWLLIVVKRGREPRVDFFLINIEELLYLNDILKGKENVQIKEYELICKNNHYYVYDENCNLVDSVDKYITDKTKASIYLYQYYQIREKRYTNRRAPHCNILEECMEVTIKTVYSQEEMNEMGENYEN